MCSIENAIDTMNKCVLVSHDVFKMLVDEYRNSHTEDAVTRMLDEQDIGVATEGEIIILLKSYRYDQEEMEKLKKTTNELKEHILALQGSANAFQVSKCESCRESVRADKVLEKLNETVDKYNELAHKYNELEANKPSSIPVHHFPEETPVIPEGAKCVGLYLLREEQPVKNLTDWSTMFYSEIEGAFRAGNKPCYFIYANDVLDAINSAALSNERKPRCPACGQPIDFPEPCTTYEDIINREG